MGLFSRRRTSDATQATIEDRSSELAALAQEQLTVLLPVIDQAHADARDGQVTLNWSDTVGGQVLRAFSTKDGAVLVYGGCSVFLALALRGHYGDDRVVWSQTDREDIYLVFPERG